MVGLIVVWKIGNGELFINTYKLSIAMLQCHQFIQEHSTTNNKFSQVFLQNFKRLNMYKIAAIATIATVAAANHPAPASAYKPAPVYAPAPAYKPVTYKAPAYDETPKPYAFEYGVADGYSGAQFNQKETSDAKVTSGQYTVALPDGRTQIVTYTVDAYNGYVADVKYVGVAQYPEDKATYKPAPAYKLAPVYKSAPAYKPAPKYEA